MYSWTYRSVEDADADAQAVRRRVNIFEHAASGRIRDVRAVDVIRRRAWISKEGARGGEEDEGRRNEEVRDEEDEEDSRNEMRYRIATMGAMNESRRRRSAFFSTGSIM